MITKRELILFLEKMTQELQNGTMTEQEQKFLDQFKTLDMFGMIPGYNDLPKVQKEAILAAFQMSIDKEKAKIANEQ